MDDLLTRAVSGGTNKTVDIPGGEPTIETGTSETTIPDTGEQVVDDDQEIPEEFRLDDESENGIDDEGEAAEETPKKPEGADDDAASPKDDEEPPEDESKPEEDPDSEAAIAARLKAIEEQLATSEKRRQDTVATYQREHQELLKLRALLEDTTKYDEWTFGDDATDGDNKAISELNAKIAALEKRERETAWNLAEAEAKAKYDDYDAVVDYLDRDWEGNDRLHAKFQAEGASPEAAYKLGAELRSKDPEFVRQQLREELKAEILAELKPAADPDPPPRAATPRAKARTMSGVRGATGGATIASKASRFDGDPLKAFS